MPFDWEAFLTGLGISFVLRGPNVSRGNINIQCPFCGQDDPSEHMGLRLSDGAWGCFRNPLHRGLSPVRLVRELKGCSFAEAHALVHGNDFPQDTSVAWLKKQLAGLEASDSVLPTVVFPKEFRSFGGRWDSERRFRLYLKSRGFSRPTALAGYYGLRYAVTGDFANRIIFPLHVGSDLIGWTSRALGESQSRYKIYPKGPGAKHLLFNELRAFKNPRKILVIVEGPIDALKLDFYGKKYGVRAVALLGLALGTGKVDRLQKLSNLYERLVLLLDREALKQNLRYEQELSILRVEFKPKLLGNYKDPGEIPFKDLPWFFKKLLKNL